MMTDTSGKEIILSAPLSVSLRMEEDVPADDLYAVFPDTAVGELCGVTVIDGGKTVFKGVVDEQERILRASGAFLRLSARSLAAYLLDNEARPSVYDHPGARLIYDRHVREYGIAAGDTDDATCFGELHVTKGMSQWGVIRAFSAACYSAVPRISADGVLYLKGLAERNTVTFGGSTGIPYVALTETIRRCDELSCVNVKLSSEDGYGYRVENRDAQARGIRRERYLNAMLGGQSVKNADIMLDKSWQKAHTVTLKCVGRHTDLLGHSAVIHDISLSDGYYISAVKYRLDSQGEYTLIKLRRRTKSCGYPAM